MSIVYLVVVVLEMSSRNIQFITGDSAIVFLGTMFALIFGDSVFLWKGGHRG